MNRENIEELILKARTEVEEYENELENRGVSYTDRYTDEKYISLKNEVLRLENQLKELPDTKKTNTNDIFKLTDELNDKRKELEEYENELENRGVSYTARYMDEKYIRLINEVKNLENNVNDLKKDEEKREQQKQEELEKIKEEILEAQKELKEYENDLERHGISYTDRYMDERYINLLNRLKNLENRLNNFEVKDVPSKEEDVEELIKEFEERKNELKEYENDLERRGISYTDRYMDEKYNRLKNEIMNLENKINLKENNGNDNNISEEQKPIIDVKATPTEEKKEEPVEFEEPIIDVIAKPVDETVREKEEPVALVPRGAVEIIPATKKEKKPIQFEEPIIDVVAKPVDETTTEKEEPVEIISSKKWNIDKKKVLIALGIAAVAVSTIVAFQALIPAIAAAQKASSISTLASAMINNAGIWHTTTLVGEQAALHGANTGLASVIAELTGEAALFNNVTGAWTIGGAELGTFATNAAQLASATAAKVSALSTTAEAFALGGLGSLGLGLLLKDKTEDYKKYKKILKELKKQDNLTENQLINLYMEISQNINLTKNEKKDLLVNTKNLLMKVKNSKKTIEDDQEMSEERGISHGSK